MKNYQPYTYLIRFKPTQQLYYGAKTDKGCNPDQFWVKYFTTSKVVEKLISEFGRESFEVIYIKLHGTGKAALGWETMYLISVDAGYNPMYLNRHNGGKNFTTLGISQSEETCNKISEATKGILKSEETKQKMRKPKSEEHRKHIGEALTGKPKSEEHREKMRENHPHLTWEDHPNFGKVRSEECKQNLRDNYSGENSSMWGKFG